MCLVTQSCLTLCDPTVWKPTRLLCLWGFSRQEYWSGQAIPSSGELPNPGMEHLCLTFAIANGFFTTRATWEAPVHICIYQFSSVAQLCPTLCNPMDCSTPGFPVHHQLLEPTQTHVLRFGDAIQPSHLLSSSSSPALNLSQYQSLFQLRKDCQLLASGGQNIGASASASLLPVNIQS